MGLGKATREAGKVGAAIQAGLWLWDLGEAIAKRLRRKPSADDPPDGAGNPERDTSDRSRDDQPELKGE